MNEIKFDSFNDFIVTISSALSIDISPDQVKKLEETYREYRYGDEDIIIDGAVWRYDHVVIRGEEICQTYTRSIHKFGYDGYDKVTKYTMTLSEYDKQEIKEHERKNNTRFVGYFGKFEAAQSKGEDVFLTKGEFRTKISAVGRENFLTTAEIKYIDDITISTYKKFNVGDIVRDRRDNTIHRVRFVTVTNNQFGYGPFTYTLDSGDLVLYSCEVEALPTYK